MPASSEHGVDADTTRAQEKSAKAIDLSACSPTKISGSSTWARTRDLRINSTGRLGGRVLVSRRFARRSGGLARRCAADRTVSEPLWSVWLSRQGRAIQINDLAQTRPIQRRPCQRPKRIEFSRTGHHSMTSALTSNDCGIVRLSEFAGLRLMTSGNFVGCSMPVKRLMMKPWLHDRGRS